MDHVVRNSHKPYNTRTVQSLVKKVATNAGICKTITPHIFRHTFATHMLEDGCDIRKIQMLLGHSNLRTTAIYLHVVSDALSKIKSPIAGINLAHGLSAAKA